MTLPDYRKLERFWQGTPPAAESLAAILVGFGATLTPPTTLDDDRVDPDAPDPVLSPAELARIFGAAGFSVH